MKRVFRYINIIQCRSNPSASTKLKAYKLAELKQIVI